MTISSPTRFQIWLQATRPFSFTASMTPVIVGAAWAYHDTLNWHWPLFFIFLVCSVLIHAGTNLVNDYFDYEKGVDQEDTLGSSGVLVQKLLTPQQVYRGACVVFGVAFVLGLTIVAVRGIGMLALGILGFLGGYFYTARPVGYKYYALGDLFVFLFMGMLLVVGAYFAMTGTMTSTVFFVSIPISLLVTAILHANNVRDIGHDRKAGIQTMASLLGHRWGKVQYFLLIGGAYLIILLMIVARILSGWALIVFISLPIAIKNIKTMQSSVSDTPASIASLDVDTAKLHLTFGLLLIVSIMLRVII